jgi:hypothetical protein
MQARIRLFLVLLPMALILVIATVLSAAGPKADPKNKLSDLPPNTWVKLSPLKETPPSPRLGYEGACAWDGRRQVMIRYGGHNQGGGGEQGSEVWTFDPWTARWTLFEPNTSPPGICCGQQNVFDPVLERYLRFPAFSASHGWQWRREVYLNDASVWSYDLATNTWRNMRPLPTATPRPLRCASWDAEHQVVVMFGGEGSSEGTWVYDPWENAWTRMNPPVEPAFRSGGNMAYDARHRLHILFGSQFNDDRHTWAYDLRANTWRDMQPVATPPTEKNDAVLTYDAAAGVVLAIIKISTGEEEQEKHRLETWTYDAGDNRWTKTNPEREPDATGNRARQLMFAPELGVALLENRPSNSSGISEQQVWAYRRAAKAATEAAGPAAPAEMRVTTRDRAAKLLWSPAVGSAPASLAVYRGTGACPWGIRFEKIATVGASTATYEDRELTKGTAYFYFVRAVGSDGREGPASRTVRTRPHIVDDVVVSALAKDRVEVTWSAPPGDDLVGYYIERAPVEVLTEDQLKRLKAQTPPLSEASVGALHRVGRFTQITAEPVKRSSFVDTAVNLSQPAAIDGETTYERKFDDEQFDREGGPYRFGVYAYRVRAVNALRVAGGASPAVLTVPSSPQFFYSKEDGESCQLRWQANPERDIRGYRVYRMDGRYDKDPITRLTAEPIAETTFADSGAGRPTRRYYVVAVDALGQEGFPSSPVWYRREWRDFYVPFTGEWHQ